MEGGGGNQGSYNDAVVRARQIAAKLTATAPGDGPAPAMGGGGAPPNAGGGGGNANMIPLGVKREFDEPGPAAKKMMTEMDPLTAQLRAIADQQQGGAQDPASAAKAAAAQVAAKINKNLGQAGAPMAGAGMGMGGGAPPGMGAPVGLNSVEEFAVPDRMVGLVIGKGGEQITRLQVESGCKVQIAPDSGGQPDRLCTLTGTPESIQHVKGLIHDIINKAKSAGTPDAVPSGQNLVEMFIPGSKVGLIIGKGGETIRMLQESTGCKMVMIQDSNAPTDENKPLRITGPLAAAEEARRRVQELLDSKDNAPPSGHTSFGNDYGSGGLYSQELVCPRSCVGIVIGKGGDMIKRIQADYSVRVQFRPDDGGPERRCQVTGSPDAVRNAIAHIQGLIEEANRHDMSGDGGMGRGRGRGMGMSRGGMGRGAGGGRGGSFGGSTTNNMVVPADKCGLIIGKGGETIREIVSMSGAHVELQRTPGPNPNEKTFEVRGTPENIQHAMSLIADKAGIPMPPGPGGAGGPPGGAGGQWGAPSGQWGQGGPGYGGQPQQQQQPQQPGWNQYGGGYNQWGAQGQQQGPPGAQPPAAGQPAAPAGQGQDAWSQYYQQYYQQQGQYPQAGGAAPGQPASNGSQPAAQPAAAAAPGAPAAGAAAATVNPQTGQPDYSEAWAQYYRSMGYHDQAEAILAQAGGAAQPQQQPATSQ